MSGDKLRVTFMNGPADGRWLTLQNPQVTIGRGSGNDVVIDFDPKVAPTHLAIEYRDGQCRLIDHSGGAGVFVDGLRILDRISLQPGRLVMIGDTLLRISITDDA